MARLTIGFGVLLILIGIIGFVATGASHFTALIPAALGLLITGAGFLAQQEQYRKHAIHAALGLALVIFLASFKGILQLPALSKPGTDRPAVVDKAFTAILCVIYIALGVRSFIAARKSEV